MQVILKKIQWRSDITTSNLNLPLSPGESLKLKFYEKYNNLHVSMIMYMFGVTYENIFMIMLNSTSVLRHQDDNSEDVDPTRIYQAFYVFTTNLLKR